MFIKETVDYIDSVIKAGFTDVRFQRAKYFGLCRTANIENEARETITTTITDDGNGERVSIDDSETLTIWHVCTGMKLDGWISGGGGFGDDKPVNNPRITSVCRMIITGRTERVKISSERLGSIVLMKIPGSVPGANYQSVSGLHNVSIGITDIITDQSQCAQIAGHSNTPGITTAVINYMISENISKDCIATCEEYSFTGC